jgi:hypothetical protein
VGSGARLSIDRDSDCLPDLDEPVLGTSAVNADTDDDGWLDGWEVFEGSDPTSAASVPTSLTAPVIHGVPELPNARPYGAERSRLRVTASGVLPGATLLATIPSGNRTTEYAIFPTGPGEWTTHADFAKDDLTGNARGWTFVIRNKTGASSPPFQAP